MTPLSKEEAVLLGYKWFYTGIACKHGHLDKRYVNTSICYGCKRSQNTRCNKNNPEALKNRSRKSYLKNKHNISLCNKAWAAQNINRVREIKKNYKLRNIEKYRAQEAQRVRKKRVNDIFFKISRNISKEVWAFLKGRKQGKTYRQFLNNNIDEIKKHLEGNFETHMSWDNYGVVWEIDHIKPLSWFINMEPLEAVKLAWSLDNLQPLDLDLNRSKQNRNNLTKKELYELYR